MDLDSSPLVVEIDARSQWEATCPIAAFRDVYTNLLGVPTRWPPYLICTYNYSKFGMLLRSYL